MNYLHEFTYFDTVEEGEKFLEEAKRLRENMSSPLWKSMVQSDCDEISKKIDVLRKKESIK
jgi:hypothetical protein